MAIERDANTLIHEEGNLRATTSWISKHDEGLAELLKNVRYAYLPNRADVEAKHHIAAVLFVDGNELAPARIGVLDVGGVTLADLIRWTVWQDPKCIACRWRDSRQWWKSLYVSSFQWRGKAPRCERRQT